MKVVFLGPPGAGKGTQAQRIAQERNLMHISTGDLLRDALKNNSPVGLKAREYMERGNLVPDDIVTEIVRECIQSPAGHNGFILDGYPRNQAQAEGLDRVLDEQGESIDLVVNFATSPEVIRERLASRRVCSGCNTIYHLKNLPPGPDGRCTHCGGELIVRPDDRDRTVEERIRVYEEWGLPLCGYYRQRSLLKEVSGELESEAQYAEVKKIFAQVPK